MWNYSHVELSCHSSFSSATRELKWYNMEPRKLCLSTSLICLLPTKLMMKKMPTTTKWGRTTTHTFAVIFSNKLHWRNENIFLWYNKSIINRRLKRGDAAPTDSPVPLRKSVIKFEIRLRLSFAFQLIVFIAAAAASHQDLFNSSRAF